MSDSVAPWKPALPLGRLEVILLALVLTIGHHAITYWLCYRVLPYQQIYDSLGQQGYFNFYDASSAIMPLLLCLGAPLRSGLTLGKWKGNTIRTVLVCVLPIVSSALYRSYSTYHPFRGDRSGIWLISPAAQDLLFSGFLFGLFNLVFPGRIQARLPVSKAVLLTAAFFAFWHLPNFFDYKTSFVCFQLLYTFIGGAWILQSRQWTGSIIPGLLSHMAVNFIGWKG
jgi:membrane protease YdiL (CAAX protease family)